MKENQITHWWANFSLKTGLSCFTSISLIGEREREREREVGIRRVGEMHALSGKMIC